MAFTDFKEDYQNQLQTKEWRKCRDEVISKDGNHCQLCGKGESLSISFGNREFYVGIDYSKDYIRCTENNRIKGLPQVLSRNSGKKDKVGLLPKSNHIGVISEEGLFCYTVWSNMNAFYDIPQDQELFVAEFVCDDGYVAKVVYSNEEELNDLVLPRVYITNRKVVLNVHHKKYILGHKAWEYGSDNFVTLCQYCHSKVHEYLPVQVYVEQEGNLKVMNYTPCIRCNGTGFLPEYEYRDNGICYRCMGARFEELIKKRDNNLQDVEL